VIRDFATLEECDALKSRANELVESFQPESITVFSTTSQVRKHVQYQCGHSVDMRMQFSDAHDTEYKNCMDC
jgi:hypothetical protein